MNIDTLMQHIWLEIATDVVKTEVQLSNDEWQLILEKWPDEYGNTGIIRKSKEAVERLREDWKSEKCFYLRGHKIRVSIR